MIKLNDKKYNVPADYKIVLDDSANGQTLATAVIKNTMADYYKDKYGNGKIIDLTKLVSAVLQRKVTITVQSDNNGLVAETDDGVIITIAQASLVKAKKAKKEKVEESKEQE